MTDEAERNSTVLKNPHSVGRVPLIMAITFVVILALAVAATVGFVGWLLLMNPRTKIGASSPKDVLDLAKVALAVAGGIGGAGALVVAYRKQLATEAEHLRGEKDHQRSERSEQREVYRSLNERFDQAVILLGNADSPAVRLSGVYSLASLAEDWPAGRQRCIDVLCAYARLPVMPGIENSGEREVRRTVFSVIREHLLEEAAQTWDGYRFDMSGATLDGACFDDIRLERSTLNLSNAKLLEGELSLKGLVVAGGCLDLSHAQLSGGEVALSGLLLDGGKVSFVEAQFSGAALACSHGVIRGGQLSFEGCLIDGSLLNFGRLSVYPTGDRRGSAPLSFNDSIIQDGRIYLGSLQYEERSSSETARDEKLVRGARRDGCWVTLEHILLNGGTVSFRESRFEGGIISLANSVLAGGRLSFAYARFTRSEVNFAGARFKGCLVDFEYSHFEGPERKEPSREVSDWVKRLERLPVEERDMVWDDHPKATLQFNSAEFWAGSLNLDHSSIHDSVFDLVGVDFRGGRISLEKAYCVRAVINLWNSRFNYESVTEIVLPDEKWLTVLWSNYYSGPLARVAIPRQVRTLEVSAAD
ncbi:pentapeptide repeat-containing protein [Micromonospora costi]|uniref:pentapeptide repeat-containing protein n=1 Tax=Micromonospora costi TaxID=1530042 RepID=UPI0011C44E3B|nr:pentapeptide repeat-containing protein [Micromonospora costi]